MCHQTVGLVARALEDAGIPTVSLTAARDITEAVRPPRAVYVHTPLGWQIGMPHDADGQRARLRAVLEAGVAVDEPGAIAELSPDYPTGVLGTPDAFYDPVLDDWEEVEYLPGYRTERTRTDSVIWPGPRPA